MQDIYQVFFIFFFIFIFFNQVFSKLKFRIIQMHCVFIFLSLLLNLLQYCFCFIVCLFFFGLRHMGSWLPKQGSNSHPRHWKVRS